MKRNFLTLIIFAFLAISNGQVTPSSGYFIQDTTYEIPPWPLNSVTDMNTNKTYLLTDVKPASQALLTTKGKIEISANAYLTNIISVGEFNPDITCSSNASPAFISAFRSDKDVIFIPKGCYLIADDIIIPHGKALVFEKGAKLDVTRGFSGNFTKIQAGQNQIFTLNSNITGSWKPHDGAAYVEWFGAKGDGTGRNDMASFQKTLDIFCTATTYGDNISSANKGIGTVVRATGNKYVIEQTLNIRAYQSLIIKRNTIMKGDTTDFFDTYVKFSSKPYYLEGGRWIVPQYFEQTGYASSAKDDAAKIQYAYTTNPVFRFFMYGVSSNIVDGGEEQYRRTATIKDIDMALSGSQESTYPYPLKGQHLFDGIVYSPDTSTTTSGELIFGVRYRITDYNYPDDFSNVGIYTPSTSGSLSTALEYAIIDYQTGDDFTNLGASSNANGVIFTPTGKTPTDWTHGSELTRTIFSASETTPLNWTNGSGITKEAQASYFDTWENLTFTDADTAMYFMGTKTGMVNSIKCDQLHFDACANSITLGYKTSGHIYTNISIQTPRITTSSLPQLDINATQCYMNGMIYDVTHDSIIIFRGGSGGNIIDLASEAGRLADRWTKDYTSIGSANHVGSIPFWHHAADGYNGNYWDKAKRLGIIGEGNTVTDNNERPAASLDIRGEESVWAPSPTLIVEGSGNGYPANWKIDSRDGFHTPLVINYRAVSESFIETVRAGMGSAIAFNASDTALLSGASNNYKQNQYGLIGFRQGGEAHLSTAGVKSAFQIWQNNDGTWLNTMTIDPEGKMGLLGVYDPEYTIDLSSAGTFRSSNIKDNGTDVKIKGKTSINILHLTPSNRPNKPTVGDMYLSGEDGNLYLYTNTGWRAVVLQ